jgi:hypothetical protein
MARVQGVCGQSPPDVGIGQLVSSESVRATKGAERADVDAHPPKNGGRRRILDDDHAE